MKYTKGLSLLLLAALLSIPFFIAHAAGGHIQGKVTDTKGGAIPGAAVTVTNQITKQDFTAVTDAQGQYKVEGLPAGSYTVRVAMKGFNEGRREGVNVADDTTATIDLQLQITPVEAEVKVTPGVKGNIDPVYVALRQLGRNDQDFAGNYAVVNNLLLKRDAGNFMLKSGELYFIVPVEGRVTPGVKGNIDPVYVSLRQLGRNDQDFAGNYAVVNNLLLKRDAGNFMLRSGELYFIVPVEGRVTAAVFIGDGELSLTPPTEIEKHSLKIFSGEDGIKEQFSRLVLRFTDKTFEEIKASPNATMKSGGPAASQARGIYRDNQELLRKRLRDNRDLRTLYDLYNPARDGYFSAFIDGKRFNKLVFLLEPLGVPNATPEEVALLSYGDTDGGLWTAFHREDEYKKGTASSAEDNRLIDITHHEIDAAIKGTRLAATDKITFRNLRAGTRVVPFDLFGSLRVSRVQDAEGNDLNFVQEDKNEDSDFGVIMPKPLEEGKTYTISIQYDGTEAIRDSGGGNYILIPRSTWYPGNANALYAEDRAIFDMTFRFPKAFTFVGTGAPTAPDAREGDLSVAKWSSGQTELGVAGFNYGLFKKKVVSDKDTGYDVEFYANVEVPDEIKAIQQEIERIESSGGKTMTTLGSISTTSIADAAIADAENAVRIYNAYYGKLPYGRIAMTQQPAGFFGQAWPTLVYMPYLAFIDTTQRNQLLGVRGGTDTFWRYVAPHEIAHQWWGHIIGWDSYHDQW